jgi:hypothetical protein
MHTLSAVKKWLVVSFLVVVTLLLGKAASARVDCYEVGDCTSCAFYGSDGTYQGYIHWCKPAN